MKYKFSAWYYKLLAWLLVLVCLAMGFFSAVITLIGLNYYYSGQDMVYQESWQCAEQVRIRGYDIQDQFQRNPSDEAWERLLADSDLRFIILDEVTGDVVTSYVDGLGIRVPENMANNIYLREYNGVMRLGEADSFLKNVYVMDYYFGYDAEGRFWNGSTSGLEGNYGNVIHAADGSYSMEAVPELERPQSEESAGSKEQNYQILYLLPKSLFYSYTDRIALGYQIWRETRWWSGYTPWIFGLCAVGLLLAVIFLCVQSGRKPERGEIRGTWLEKVPLEIHLFVDFWSFLGVAALSVAAWDTQSNSYITLNEWYLAMILCALGAMACAAVLVELIVTIVLRAKLGILWRSTLCSHLFRGIGRLFSGIIGIIVKGIRSIGMVPRALLCFVAILAVEFFNIVWLMNVYNPVFPVVFIVVFNLFLLLAGIWALAQMQILQKAASAMADGDLDHHVDTAHMYWAFMEHAENLNAISDGMSKAVDKQMKSERLKTELITNVSHDIKTPLTSIVNYVDLLQKPHTEAEGIQYLEVLDRQSKRLKKLTENLVEASKASTGNMAVNLEPTSVMELINQAVEEYRDRLEAGKLEIVVSQRGDLSILADGKLMWRMMDNLLNNVVKYALSGTRVYVTAQKEESHVVLAVKNISRDPLNVDADELMERFVRGDSSRHTEGSGLGLNIVQSLTKLQNGQFSLVVDGDFFKAEIRMPVA